MSRRRKKGALRRFASLGTVQQEMRGDHAGAERVERLGRIPFAPNTIPVVAESKRVNEIKTGMPGLVQAFRRIKKPDNPRTGTKAARRYL